MRVKCTRSKVAVVSVYRMHEGTAWGVRERGKAMGRDTGERVLGAKRLNTERGRGGREEDERGCQR